MNQKKKSVDKKKDMVERINIIIGNITPPDTTWTSEQITTKEQLLIDTLSRTNVTFDELGLIVPHKEDEITHKIAGDLAIAKQRMDEARQAGKHVIHLPGSYDLSHAGHASYVLQVTDHYLAENPNLTRDDLFIVMMADDDETIREVKAYKWQGKGGKEAFRRPIVSSDVFNGTTNTHPRLLDLATLPIDLVAFIPSPAAAETLLTDFAKAKLITPKQFEQALDMYITKKNPPEIDIKELREAAKSYELLYESLNKESYSKVVESFKKLGDTDVKRDPAKEPWTVQAWMFLLHNFLAGGNNSQTEGIAPFTRVVSKSDDKYIHQVDFLMRLAGVNVSIIHDVEVISTTALLAKHGPEALVEAKKSHFSTNGHTNGTAKA